MDSPSLANDMLASVSEVLENLIRASAPYQGLFPSCLELKTHTLPASLPAAINGQRDCDRSPQGSNLVHDLPTIGLLYELGSIINRGDFAEAADRYLQTFAKYGTKSATGLFAWGEHAYIDLQTWDVGDSYLFAVYEGKATLWHDQLPRPVWHDHLRQAPRWFWSRLGQIAPEALQRFADGLDRHWVTDERKGYNRHAGLSRSMRHDCARVSPRSCDFPRHSGFYIFDLAMAHVHAPRGETLQQLRRYADYWWDKFTPGECLRHESQSPADDADFYEIASPSQTLSLAVSLLEAGEILDKSEASLAALLKIRATAYAEAFLLAPHDLPKGIFVNSYRLGSRKVTQLMPSFGSVYGIYSVSCFALLCCAWYRYTHNVAFLDWARAGGKACVAGALESGGGGLNSNATVHQGRQVSSTEVPAIDSGLALEAMADLYELTGERHWLNSGLQLWPSLRERYFQNGLVRLHSGGGWYEAQQGSAYLLHGVARLGLLAADRSEGRLSSEYTAR